MKIEQAVTLKVLVEELRKSLGTFSTTDQIFVDAIIDYLEKKEKELQSINKKDNDRQLLQKIARLLNDELGLTPAIETRIYSPISYLKKSIKEAIDLM